MARFAPSVTHRQRNRVYTALRQNHLPKLEAVGIAEYDSARGALSRLLVVAA